VKDALKLDFNDNITQVHFIKLILRSAAGKEVGEAFYWRSRDAYKGAWTMTGPAVSGFSDIDKLPRAILSGSVKRREASGKIFLNVRIKNTSDKISFFTQVRLMDKEGAVLPETFCSDNFFSLLPDESRNVTIEVPVHIWGKAKRLATESINAGQVTLSAF
jgi:hypothetical protein